MSRHFHLALAVDDVIAVITDYSERLGAPPIVRIGDSYALWRTEEINLSVSKASTGEERLRHVGFEDNEASVKSYSTDSTGLLWEHFTISNQDDEIEQIFGSS